MSNLNNPGKYDDACTIARMMCNSEAAFLIILNGSHSQGFSVQCPPEMVKDIPNILRTITIMTINESLEDMQRQLSEAAAHPMTKDYLRQAAEAVHAKLPDNHDFLLIAAPYGDGEGRLVYTSTFQRADALNVLKEFLLRNDSSEDWMKHIK